MSFGVVATVVGVGYSIYNAKNQSDAAEQQADTEAANMRFNSAQSRREAERVRKVGAEDAFTLRRDLRHRLARNRVATAAAGAEATGTPLENELMLVRDFAADITTIAEQARLESQELDLLADFQAENATDVQKAGVIRQRTAITQGVADVTSILGQSNLFG
jgi:hypothetical protein